MIDAFNNDKPYDRFIREQIAGDEVANVMGAGELPNVGPEETVALTFLRLAPFTEPRGDETRHEMLSEMAATVSSVFLGLTVGCAKCHDHKYDAIPTKDFYRMKAFFATVQIPPPRRGDGFQIGGPLPASFYRAGEKEWVARKKASLQGEVDAARGELEALKKTLRERSEANAAPAASLGAGFGLQALGGSFGNDYVFDRRVVNDGEPHAVVATAAKGAWKFFTDGVEAGSTGGLSGSNRGRWFGGFVPAAKANGYVAIGAHTEGTGRSESADSAPHKGHFAEMFVWDHALNGDELAAFSAYATAKYQRKNGEVPAPPTGGLRLWLDAGDLDADAATSNPKMGSAVSTWVDKVAGLRLSQAKNELAPKLESLGPRGAPAVRFDGDLLVGFQKDASWTRDAAGSLAVVFRATHQGEGYGVEFGGAGQCISTFTNPAAVKGRGNEDLFRFATPAERRTYRWLEERPKFVRQHMKRLQPLAMSLRHSFGPPYEPGVPTSRVMVRGEWNHPGEAVEPGFLSAIVGHQKPAAIRLDPFKRWPTRSRRMTLANWIASRDNPLTARVMVNRLWLGHFGQGIVRTPSDFGKLSGGPSHPELLDWLASRFVDAKWSLKAVHRLILNSATYRQTSKRRDENAEIADPDNRLLWRFTRRRLEAEAVRDNVLAVSGGLNPESYGLPIFPPLPDGIADAVKWNESKWATDRGAAARRRSIYIYQQRTLSMPLMQVFDSVVCDETRPRRRASTTSLQALSMYNGEFAQEEAVRFAARVRKEAGEDLGARIDRAFALAFGRAPAASERVAMETLVRRSASEAGGDGLLAMCRVLFNTSEFIYVD